MGSLKLNPLMVTPLGGDDIDDRIVRYFIEEFKKEHGIDLTNDRMALQRLKEAAEKAKIDFLHCRNRS